MTFPGVEGVKGPGWLSTTGFQIRQSRAGAQPGHAVATSAGVNVPSVSVLDSMGLFAPNLAEPNPPITAISEYQHDPQAIEKDNFELSQSSANRLEVQDYQFGVGAATPDTFNNAADADPTYSGE